MVFIFSRVFHSFRLQRVHLFILFLRSLRLSSHCSVHRRRREIDNYVNADIAAKRRELQSNEEKNKKKRQWATERKELCSVGNEKKKLKLKASENLVTAIKMTFLIRFLCVRFVSFLECSFQLKYFFSSARSISVFFSLHFQYVRTMRKPKNQWTCNANASDVLTWTTAAQQIG